jgi:hypothetical protein
MAQDDYGPAQPIYDVFKGAYKKANHIYNVVTGGGDMAADAEKIVDSKPDQNYQSDMLKRANDSFKSNQIPTQTKAQKRPAVSAKVQIKTSVKPGPQKAVGGK